MAELESFEAPMEDSDLILDAEVLGKLETIMTRDRVIALAESFLNGVIARAGRIAVLTVAGDLARLGREAHDLKSTSGSFGARRLQYLSEQLEAACREDDLAAAGRHAGAIAAVLPDTLEAVLFRYPQVQLDADSDSSN
jgi:HPt (histidine-containing phosphotransfer) domain-containing protein